MEIISDSSTLFFIPNGVAYSQILQPIPETQIQTPSPTTPMNLDPSLLILLSIILAMTSNLISRTLLTFFSVMVDGTVDATVQRIIYWITICLGYIPAAGLHLGGILCAWHIHHVSTVWFTSILDVVALLLLGFLNQQIDKNLPWSICHFRTQKNNLLFAHSLLLCIVIFVINTYWDYSQYAALNLLVALLLVLNLVMGKLEIIRWKKVGVDITGSLDNG